MALPPQYAVVTSTTASRDIRSIANYLMPLSPKAAGEVVDRIVKAIDSLERMPYRFAVPRYGPVKGTATRVMVVHPYAVRYRVDDRKMTVVVVSARHGARRKP